MTDRDLIESVVDTNEGAAPTNDPADRDGPLPTRYGVTAGAYARFIGIPASQVKAADITGLTRDTAVTILLRLYVAQPGFGALSDPRVKLAAVDYAIHSGPEVAVRALQRALHVKVDGICGPATIAAANAERPAELVAALCAERLRGWARLWHADKRQLRWAGGWVNRLARILDEGARA